MDTAANRVVAAPTVVYVAKPDGISASTGRIFPEPHAVLGSDVRPRRGIAAGYHGEHIYAADPEQRRPHPRRVGHALGRSILVPAREPTCPTRRRFSGRCGHGLGPGTPGRGGSGTGLTVTSASAGQRTSQAFSRGLAQLLWHMALARIPRGAGDAPEGRSSGTTRRVRTCLSAVWRRAI